jgi:hypothetical protein
MTQVLLRDAVPGGGGRRGRSAFRAAAAGQAEDCARDVALVSVRDEAHSGHVREDDRSGSAGDGHRRAGAEDGGVRGDSEEEGLDFAGALFAGGYHSAGETWPGRAIAVANKGDDFCDRLPSVFIITF